MSEIIDAAWLDAHPGARKLKTASKTKGYAAEPGTGPKGETCGSCNNHVRKHMANTYHKCRLMHAAWTGGGKTDIRVRAPACRFWEKGDGHDFSPPH